MSVKPWFAHYDADVAPTVAPLTSEQQQAEIMKKLVGLWEKAGADTRRSFLDHIGDQDDLSFLEAAQ